MKGGDGMTANVRVYDGAAADPESNLLRTVKIENVLFVTENKNEIHVAVANNEAITFPADKVNILIT